MSHRFSSSVDASSAGNTDAFQALVHELGTGRRPRLTQAAEVVAISV